MQCPLCRTENAELSKFCSECGTNLSDPGSDSPGPEGAARDASAGAGPQARTAGTSPSAGAPVNHPSDSGIHESPAAGGTGEPHTVGGDTLPSPPPPLGTSLRDAILGTLPMGVTFAARYEIQEVIGRGGMGTVYKAHDKNLDEAVALKLIRPDLVPLGTILDRFKSETRLARRLAHPNIIKVYDLSDSDGLVYLSMEYLEGMDLRTRIVQDGPLPIDESIDIACQLAAGLSHAHANGVMHRDIKPHNVFLGSDGRVKLLDFGLAKAVDSTQLSSTGQMLGTPLYMAPEQASPERGETPDHRADIYSLGVVLYQMFTGMPPFQGTTPVEVAMLHLKQDPQPPSEIRPEIPEHVQHVVLTLLSKNRNERPVDAAEIIAAFRSGSPLKPSGVLPPPGSPAAAAARRGAARELALTLAPDISGSRLRKALPPVRRLAAIPRAVWIAALAGALLVGTIGLYLRSPHLSSEQKVEQLTFMADGYFEKGQLVEPKGRNALELYRRIIQIQPLNHKAIDRIGEIFKDLVKRAGGALDRAAQAPDSRDAAPALAEASKWFGFARTLNPEDPAVAELALRTDRIAMAFAERDTQRTRLAAQLDQADRFMAEGQLARPAGANALETYRQVLAADSTNARARDGVGKVAALLKSQANDLQKRDPFLARERFQEARDAAPDDPELRTALASLDKEIERRESRAKETATVQRLLNQARDHAVAGKLVRPQGDSALDRYRQVLAMAPGNTEARKGLDEIAVHLVALARQEGAAGHYEAARQSLGDALGAVPGHAEATAELAKVEGQIQRVAEDEKRRQRVASSLARAEGLRNLGQLVEPEDANALDAYRAVLDLDPENAHAKDALVAIRTELAETARSERKADHLEEARTAYARALKAAPGDDALSLELVEVTRAIDKERAAAAASANAVQKFLTQAEGYLLRNQLTLPPDRNALDAFRKVLATEPGNAKALAGLREVGHRLVALGDEQLAKGNPKGALAYYQRALIRERPDDGSLAAKIREARAHIAQEEAAAAAAANAPATTVAMPPGDTTGAPQRGAPPTGSGTGNEVGAGETKPPPVGPGEAPGTQPNPPPKRDIPPQFIPTF